MVTNASKEGESLGRAQIEATRNGGAPKPSVTGDYSRPEVRKRETGSAKGID
jgi:hypothetical protein